MDTDKNIIRPITFNTKLINIFNLNSYSKFENETYKLTNRISK